MLNNQVLVVVIFIIQQLAKSCKYTNNVFSGGIKTRLNPASDYFVLFGLEKNNSISFK